MAKGIQAGTLSIEIIAEVARLQADMDRVKRVVKDASADIAKSAKYANDNISGMGKGMGVATRSAGQMKSGMQQLSFQLNDVATGFSSGTPPMQIFAQQASQVVQALQMMNGSTKGLLGFLGGPWGAVLTAATVVLAPFVMKLFQGAEGSKEHEKALKEQAKAIEALDDITGRGNKTQEQRIALGVAATKVVLAQARATRDATKAELERAIAQAERANAAATGGRALNAGAGYVAANAITDVNRLRAALVENSKAIAENEERLRAAGRPALMANVIAMTDKHAAAVKRLTDAQKLLDQAFDSGRMSRAEYTAKSVVLQNQLHASENATKNANAAQRAHNKELREAAKAAREAAKTQKEYEKSMMGRVQSGTFIGQVITDLGKSRDEFMKGVEKEWASALQDTVRIVQNAQEIQTAIRVREDQKASVRAVKTAHEVADIIGGSFGRAIERLADVLQRQFPEAMKAIGEMLGGVGGTIGKLFKEWMKGAAVGGAAASATGGSTLGGMFGGAAGKGIGELLTKGLPGILSKLGGPVGAIAGGILGGVVGGLFKKVKKASATIEIMAGDAMQTSLTGNSAKLKKAAGAMADSLISGLTGIADQLGGLLGDGIKVSIGQRKKTFRVDLQGLGRTKNMPSFETEAEAVAFAIQEVIKQGAIVGLRAGTEALLKGEGDLEAQLQKALTFEGVFKDLEQRTNPAKAAIADIAREFDKLLDIFDEAKASTEDYAKLQDLMAIRQREALEQAFEPIRTLLDDLKAKADSAGDALKTAFDEVLSREANAISAYQDAVAAEERAAAEKRSAGRQRWMDIVTEGYNQEIDRLKAGIDTIATSIDAMRSEAEDLAQIAKRLNEFAGNIFAGSNAQRTANFSASAARTAAQAGDIDALQALKDVAISTAGDRATMLRNLAVLKIETDKAAASFGGRASAIEAQIAAAEAQTAAINKQIEGIEQQIELFKKQNETLDDIAETGVSVADALQEMQSAVEAADEARAIMAKFGELTDVQTSFADAVAAYEAAKADRDDLIRQITEAGFADLIAVQKQTGSQMLAALTEASNRAIQAEGEAAAAIRAAQALQQANAQAANDNKLVDLYNSFPFFAGGGVHRGGLRIVGEDGPELEMTGPSRIMNGDQIAAALVGGGDAGAIGAAVAEHLKPILYPMVKATVKLYDLNRRWDGDGQPPERDVA